MRPLNILFIIVVPPGTFNGDEITLLKLELISKRLVFVDPSAALKLNFVKKRKSKVYYVPPTLVSLSHLPPESNIK